MRNDLHFKRHIFASDITVSLVIPVRNEAGAINYLFEDILRQTYYPEEVILVDGGSTDETFTLLKGYERLDGRFIIIQTNGAHPGQGRNIGILASKSEWIALTDAGIRLESDWLERLIEVVENDLSIDIVYGNYEPVIENFFERCASLAYVVPKKILSGNLMRGPCIASCLLKKSIWETIGGFPDGRAAEDLIFMNYVETAGFKIGWAPRATVWWQLRPDLLSTFRKFVLYSKHNVWAGMQRYWHYGIARQYAVYLAAVLLMIFHSLWWGLVPVLGFGARTLKSIWVRREGRGILWALNPAQFVGVVGILLTIDVATFLGWIQAKTQRGAKGKPE